MFVCVCARFVSDVVRGADHVFLQSCGADANACSTLTVHQKTLSFSSSSPSMIYSSFRIELFSRSKFQHNETNPLFRYIHYGDNITFHVLRDAPVTLSASDPKHLTFSSSNSNTVPSVFQLIHTDSNMDQHNDYHHQHISLRNDTFMLRIVNGSRTQSPSYLGVIPNKKSITVGVTDQSHALVLSFAYAGKHVRPTTHIIRC